MKKYPEISDDYKALKFAMQPHISGTFDYGSYEKMHDNAGLGLFFIRQIAVLAGGCFYLGSENCLSDIWSTRDGEQGKKIFHTVNPEGGWPGTFAMIHLQKDAIADFEAILSTCRGIAEVARKNPAELSLDFLDEVPSVPDALVVRVDEFEEDVEAAAMKRDQIVKPALLSGRTVILDFSTVDFATQSFVHALMYEILRDYPRAAACLSLAHCSKSTEEAIRVVAGYAATKEEDVPESWRF